MAIAVFQWMERKWVLVDAIGALSSLDVDTGDKLKQPGRFEGQRILVGIRRKGDPPVKASVTPKD